LLKLASWQAIHLLINEKTNEFARETRLATLKQIKAKLKRLQAKTGTVVAERAQAVKDEVHEVMTRHGLTAEDIAKHGEKRRRNARTQVTFPAPAGRRETMSSLARRGKLPAKYRNPETGDTWSGWGRPPAWIASFKDRSKFLIDAEGNESIKPRKASAKYLTTSAPKKGNARTRHSKRS
jgi:DNA-binding protein H-NS